MLGERCILGPWIKFKSANQPGKFLWCQPDALILNIRLGTINIVEIKLRHTSDAWWQIRSLYEPVVRRIFGKEWEYLPIEIVKWFDPHTKFPERLEFVKDVIDIPMLSPGKFHIYVWNGKLLKK